MLSFRSVRLFVSSAVVACLVSGFSSDASAQPSSSFVGRRLGKNRYGEEVKVTREVGAGFTDRWQAIAAARLTGSEAVLVRTRDGKLHALATTANAYGGITPADDGEVTAILPLPSPKDAAATNDEVDVRFAARMLGVEPNEVRLTSMQEDRKPGVVNANARLDVRIGGTHGSVGARNQGFTPFAPTAIEINRSLFSKRDAREPSAAFFHENVHRADYELAQRWVKAFIADRRMNPELFDARVPVFRTWLLKQTNAADAETVVDVAQQLQNSTEARAYVRTFIAATQAGAYDVARETLRVYAREVAPKQRPSAESVMLGLRAELDAELRSLDAEGQKKLRAAFADAVKGAPSSWLTEFELGARPRAPSSGGRAAR